MINASEAKAMVKAWDTKQQEAAERLSVSVLAELERAITEKAKAGRTICIVKIPDYMKSARINDIVMTKLHENGFKVTTVENNPNMMIEW